MMRVVYLLTASMPGVMPRLKWEKRDNGALALVIPADACAALYGERPDGRLAQLARISRTQAGTRGRPAEPYRAGFSRASVDRPAARPGDRQREEAAGNRDVLHQRLAVHEGERRIVAALAVVADEAGSEAEGREQQRGDRASGIRRRSARRRPARTGRSPKRPEIGRGKAQALRNRLRCPRCRRARTGRTTTNRKARSSLAARSAALAGMDAS